MYGHGAVRGVVRFVQVDEHTTLIEGSLVELNNGTLTNPKPLPRTHFINYRDYSMLHREA